MHIPIGIRTYLLLGAHFTRESRLIYILPALGFIHFTSEPPGDKSAGLVLEWLQMRITATILIKAPNP